MIFHKDETYKESLSISTREMVNSKANSKLDKAVRLLCNSINNRMNEEQGVVSWGNHVRLRTPPTSLPPPVFLQLIRANLVAEGLVNSWEEALEFFVDRELWDPDAHSSFPEASEEVRAHRKSMNLAYGWRTYYFIQHPLNWIHILSRSQKESLREFYWKNPTDRKWKGSSMATIQKRLAIFNQNVSSVLAFDEGVPIYHDKPYAFVLQWDWPHGAFRDMWRHFLLEAGTEPYVLQHLIAEDSLLETNMTATSLANRDNSKRKNQIKILDPKRMVDRKFIAKVEG